jgi:hypothetical protein
MTVRDYASVADSRRAPARTLDVCLFPSRGSNRGPRNTVHHRGIRGRRLKPTFRPIREAIAIGHYGHVHGPDPVQTT